ncbi:hypothetical protein AAMO2058_000460300 [Amorphochlora amoebiformis]
MAGGNSMVIIDLTNEVQESIVQDTYKPRNKKRKRPIISTSSSIKLSLVNSELRQLERDIISQKKRREEKNRQRQKFEEIKKRVEREHRGKENIDLQKKWTKEYCTELKRNAVKALSERMKELRSCTSDDANRLLTEDSEDFIKKMYADYDENCKIVANLHGRTQRRIWMAVKYEIKKVFKRLVKDILQKEIRRELQQECARQRKLYERNQLISRLSKTEQTKIRAEEKVVHDLLEERNRLKAKCVQLKQKLEEKDDDDDCCICMDSPPDTVFNCGHMTCYTCYGSLSNTCPQCRTKIEVCVRIREAKR